MMNNDLLNRFMATPLEREHGNNCVEMRIERHGIVDLVFENGSDWRLAYANGGFPTLLKVFQRGVVSITGMYDLEEGILISLCNGNRMSWQ